MNQISVAQCANVLENAFFQHVDRSLVVRLSQQQTSELETAILTTVTGVVDRDVLRELINADITPKTLLAFSLFPSVYVAWADGQIQKDERDAILKAARDLGLTSTSDAFNLLDSWLQHPPEPELIEAWKQFVVAFRPSVSERCFQDLHSAAVTRAEQVALAAGGLLGLHKVSKAEQRLLDELKTIDDSR